MLGQCKPGQWSKTERFFVCVVGWLFGILYSVGVWVVCLGCFVSFCDHLSRNPKLTLNSTSLCVLVLGMQHLLSILKLKAWYFGCEDIVPLAEIPVPLACDFGCLQIKAGECTAITVGSASSFGSWRVNKVSSHS